MTNRKRITKVGQIMVDNYDPWHKGVLQENVVDLLTDLIHFTTHHGLDLYGALDSAVNHFNIESNYNLDQEEV